MVVQWDDALIVDTTLTHSVDIRNTQGTFVLGEIVLGDAPDNLVCCPHFRLATQICNISTCSFGCMPTLARDYRFCWVEVMPPA